MAKQTVTHLGAFTQDSRDKINDNFTDLYAGGGGTTFASPTITGTIAGSPTITTPTIASSAGIPYVAGVAAGYKIARSAVPLAVTGTSDVTTGLTTVLSVSVTAADDLDGVTFAGVSAALTGGAGHVLIKCWKVTGTGDATMIAATAAKNVHWIAVGT